MQESTPRREAGGLEGGVSQTREGKLTVTEDRLLAGWSHMTGGISDVPGYSE